MGDFIFYSNFHLTKKIFQRKNFSPFSPNKMSSYVYHNLLIILLGFANAANWDVAKKLIDENFTEDGAKLLLDAVGSHHKNITTSVSRGEFKQLPQPNPNQQPTTTTRAPSPGFDLDSLLDLEQEISRRQIRIPTNDPTVELRSGIRPPSVDPYSELFRPIQPLHQPPPQGPSNIRPPIYLPPGGPVQPGQLNQHPVIQPPQYQLGQLNQHPVIQPPQYQLGQLNQHPVIQPPQYQLGQLNQHPVMQPQYHLEQLNHPLVIPPPQYQLGQLNQHPVIQPPQYQLGQLNQHPVIQPPQYQLGQLNQHPVMQPQYHLEQLNHPLVIPPPQYQLGQLNQHPVIQPSQYQLGQLNQHPVIQPPQYQPEQLNQPLVIPPPQYQLGQLNQHPVIQPPQQQPGQLNQPDGGQQHQGQPIGQKQIAEAVENLNNNLRKSKQKMRDKWKRTQKIRFGGEWPRRQPLSWEHQIELANIYEARDPQFVEAARRYRAREGLRKNQHAPLRDDFVQGLRGLYQRGHVWPSFIKDRYGVAQYNLNNELVSRNIQLYAITKNNGDQGTSRGFEIAKQELLGHLERREVGGSPLPAKVPSPPSSPEPEHTIGEGPSTSAGGRSQLPKRPMPVLPTTQEEEESRRIVEEFLELPPAADQPSGSGLGQIPDPPNVAPPSPKRKRKRPPADQQPSHSGALPTSSGEGSSSGHGQGTSGGRNHPPAHSSPGERSAQPPHRGGIIPSLPPRSNPADLLPGPSNVMPEGRRGRSRSGSPSRSLSTPGVSPSAKRANRGPMGRRRRKRNAQSA